MSTLPKKSSSLMLELIETGSLGLVCILGSTATGWLTSGLDCILGLRTLWTFNFGFLVTCFGAGDSLRPCEICGDNRLMGFFSLSCGEVPKCVKNCLLFSFVGEVADVAWALVWATGGR